MNPYEDFFVVTLHDDDKGGVGLCRRPLDADRVGLYTDLDDALEALDWFERRWPNSDYSICEISGPVL